MQRTLRLFYRYGFSEKEVFRSCADCFYGLAISAHMLAYTESSVYATLMRAIQENKGFPFFIDPMTYVFARRIDNLRVDGNIKRSFKKLMSEYGPTVAACLDNGELQSDQFILQDGTVNQAVILELVQKVLDFQQTKLNTFTTKSSVPKYARILKKTPPTAPLVPSFLVAPYFYWVSRNDPWYKINLALSNIANSNKGDLQLYPVLCFSKELLLDQLALREIVKDYAGFDGYFVWVSGLDEEIIPYGYIVGLRALVRALSEYQRPMYSLYGGYLMLVLSKFGLTGFCTGICYGDYRDVDAEATTGGGLERYYLPTMHLKRTELRLRAALSVSANNARLLCDCNVCEPIRTDLAKALPMPAKKYVDQFFDSLGSRKNGFREHFVRARYREVLSVEKETTSEAATRLRGEAQQIDNSNPPPPPGPNPLMSRHLRDWAQLLS